MAIHILFGEKLRVERKRLGLTTTILAEKCGVSRSYITLIENNKRLPGKKILPKIAIALQLEQSIVLNWYLEEISRKILAPRPPRIDPPSRETGRVETGRSGQKATVID